MELAPRFAVVNETGFHPGQSIAKAELNVVLMSISIVNPTEFALVGGQVVALVKQADSKQLVPLLPGYDFGTDVAIYAVYPHRRYLPAKTRVFIDYLAESFGPEPYWDQPAAASAAKRTKIRATV